MFSFLVDHFGTIIVLCIVIALIVIAAIILYRDHKKGKTSCGCQCDGCPNSHICHQEQSTEKE